MVGGVAGDIVGTGEIGLALGVQSAHPAPAQRIRRRVTINEVLEEEIRAQFPIQPQGENPDARKPHAGVVVQVAGFDQFAGPVIERLNTGVATRGIVVGFPKARIAVYAGQRRVARFEIAGPYAWALFEVAFEVNAPKHFSDELLRRAGAVLPEHRVDHFRLSDQPRVQPWRELRDVGPCLRVVGWRAVVMAAAIGVSASGPGQKVGEACKPSLA